MTIKRKVETERCDVVDVDDDSYRKTIVGRQTETDASSMDGYHPPIRSKAIDYETTDGCPVNDKGDGTFEVLDGIETHIVRRA